MLIELEIKDTNYEFGKHIESEYDEQIPADLIKNHQIKEYLTLLIPEQVEEYLLIIKEGKCADDVICIFYECLFACIHLELLEDTEANERNNYLPHMQTCDPAICYPCAIDPRTIF